MTDPCRPYAMGFHGKEECTNFMETPVIRGQRMKVMMRFLKVMKGRYHGSTHGNMPGSRAAQVLHISPGRRANLKPCNPRAGDISSERYRCNMCRFIQMARRRLRCGTTTSRGRNRGRTLYLEPYRRLLSRAAHWSLLQHGRISMFVGATSRVGIPFLENPHARDVMGAERDTASRHQLGQESARAWDPMQHHDLAASM